MQEFNENIFELNQLKIRLRLAELDKPQSWLAKQIGETRQRWHYYYKIKSLKNLDKISNALGVPEKDLVSPINDFF